MTKLDYRFLSNDRVSEPDILSVHFQTSADRFKTALGPNLVLQETTTFAYQGERPELIGCTGNSSPTAPDLCTFFLVRTCADRLAGGVQGKVQGLPRVEIRAHDRGVPPGHRMEAAEDRSLPGDSQVRMQG